jgi:hypothetical protein
VEEPQGEPCSTFRIVWSAAFIEASGNPFFYTEDMLVWGKTIKPYVIPSPAGLNPIEQVFIECQGLKYLGEDCGEYRVIGLTNFDSTGGIQDFEVTVFEEVVSP